MIVRLDDISKEVPGIGKKAFYLGRMLKMDFPVPSGMVITAGSFRDFFRNIESVIYDKLEQDPSVRSARIQSAILNSSLPRDLEHEISRQYTEMDLIPNLPKDTARLIMSGRDAPPVAVRISSEAEMPLASSLLNVYGAKQVSFAVKKALSSIFSSQMLEYKKLNMLSEDSFMSNAVIVQKFIPAEFYGTVMPHPVQENSWLVEYSDSSNAMSSLIYGSANANRILFDRIKKEMKTEKQFWGENIMEGRYELGRILEYAEKLEQSFGEPMFMEWCIAKDRIWILGAKEFRTLKNTVSGRAKRHTSDISRGDIFLAENCTADISGFADKISAVVSEKGSYSSKLSFLCRALSIPFFIMDESKNFTENEEIAIGPGFREESGEESKKSMDDRIKSDDLRITKLIALMQTRGDAEKREGYDPSKFDGIIISERAIASNLADCMKSVSYLSNETDDFSGVIDFDKALVKRIISWKFDPEQMQQIISKGFRAGCVIKSPYDMLRSKEICALADVVIFEIREIVQLMSSSAFGRLDSVMLKQIRNSVRKCRDSNARCYAYDFISDEEAPEDTAEKLILAGMDGFVVNAPNFGEVDRIVQRAEKKILLDLARKNLSERDID